MKFLQIAVASDAENGQSLYALGEDSNMQRITISMALCIKVER